MPKINLLDWREELRSQRQQQFALMMVASLLLAGTIIGVIYLGFSGAINYQNDRNAYLEREITLIEKKIAEIKELEKVKANLLSRMRVIESLQQSRSRTVHFFDEVVATLPDGVFLTNLQQKGKSVTIKGVAESNGRVSSYMKNLEASPWFSNPVLIVIKAMAGKHSRVSEFTLKVTNLSKPAGEGDDEDDEE